MKSWRLKRQLIGIIAISIVVILIVSGIIYYFNTFGSCNDGLLNQNEERTDCGGDCTPCIDANVQDPTILWARFFEIGPDTYDVAARVRNTNQIAGGEAIYTFTLRDDAGNAIARSEGVATLFPNEEHIVFEANIVTGATPKTVSFSVEVPEWKRLDKRDIPVNIVSQKFSPLPAPRVVATIENQSLFTVENFSIAVLLHDVNGNIIGVSKTKVDEIAGSARMPVVFTWPDTSLLFDPERITFVTTPGI